jgi:hypothetical protein
MISMRSCSGAGSVERVRRRDEHHLREVVVEIEVVVVERRVLLGIEHLEQRRRRIAAEVGRHLVDLVEQEHRVPDPAFFIDWMILPGSAPM